MDGYHARMHVHSLPRKTRDASMPRREAWRERVRGRGELNGISGVLASQALNRFFI